MKYHKIYQLSIIGDSSIVKELNANVLTKTFNPPLNSIPTIAMLFESPNEVKSIISPNSSPPANGVFLEYILIKK